MKKLAIIFTLFLSINLLAQYGPESPSYDDIKIIETSSGDVVDFAETPLVVGNYYQLEIYAPDANATLDSGSVKFLYHGTANTLGLNNPGSQPDLTDYTIVGDTIVFTFSPQPVIGFTTSWYKMQLDIELFDSLGNATSRYSNDIEHWTFLNKNVFAQDVNIYDYTKFPADEDTLERYNDYRINWDGQGGSAITFLAIRQDSSEDSGKYSFNTDWQLLNGESLNSNLRAYNSATILVPENMYEFIGRNSINSNDSISWVDIATSNLAAQGENPPRWQDFIDNGYGIVDSIYFEDSKAPQLDISNIWGNDIIKLSNNLIVEPDEGSNINTDVITFDVDEISETRDLSQMSLHYREIGETAWSTFISPLDVSKNLKFEVNMNKNQFPGSRYEFAAVGIDDVNNVQSLTPQDTLLIERGENAPFAEIFNIVGNLEYGNDSISINYKVYDDFFVKKIQFLPPNAGWATVAENGDTLSGIFTVVSNLRVENIGKYMTLSLLVEDFAGAQKIYNITKLVTDEEDNYDDPPIVRTPLNNVYVDEDAANTRISLEELFTDPDNNDRDIAKIIYQGGSTTVFNSQISNDTLIIEYLTNEFGVRDIIIQGTSNTKIAYDTMSVVVYPINDPPTSKNREVTILEDFTAIFSNEDFNFADTADGDAFGGVKILSNPLKGLLEYQSSEVKLDSIYTDLTPLTYTPELNDTGFHYASFNFKVVDDHGLECDTSYTVYINISNSDNGPTVKNPASNITVLEDANSTYFIIDTIFTDIDNNDDDIVESIYTVTNQDIISVTQAEDTINVEFLPNKNGTSKIIIEGLSNGKSAFDTVEVNIAPINDNPTGANSTLTVNEDLEHIFDEDDFPYEDVDNDPFGGIKVILNVSNGVLTYNDEPITENVDYTDISKLKFIPAENGEGFPYTSFYYQVRDASGGYSNAMYKMTINVVNIDDAPIIINPIPDVVVNEDTSNTEIFLGNVFTDIDNDDELIEVAIFENDNETLVHASISNDTLILSYAENLSGNAVLLLSAQSNGKFVYDAVRITVNPVNDLPVSADVEITIGEDEPYTLSESLFYYTDIENNEMDGLQLITKPAKGLLKYNKSEVTNDTHYPDLSKLVFTPAKNDTGSPYTSFEFKIRDDDNGVSDDTYTFTINVDESDDPPEILNLLSDIEVDEDFDTTYIALDTVFTDSDNHDSLIVKEITSNTNSLLVLATLVGDSIKLEYQLNQFGNASIVVKATSGGKSITDNFDIIVNPVNDGPVGADREITINEEGSHRFSLDDFVYSDIEGDFFIGIKLVDYESNGDLEYWSADVAPNVDIPENSHQIATDIQGLVFKPFSHGTGSPYATFEYLLKDSRGAYSDTAYTVTINVLKTNDPPEFSKVLTDTIINENELFTFNYEVTDPDDDVITYYLDSMQIYESGDDWFTVDTSIYGVKFDSTNGDLNWQSTYEDEGTFKFHLSATDCVYTCYTNTTIEVKNVNRKPIFTSFISDTTIHNDTNFNFDYVAIDDDGQTVRYGMLYYVEGLALNRYGRMSWTIAEEPDTNLIDIEVYATDGVDSTFTSARVTILDVVAIDDEDGTPNEFSLAPAYPNPFNPTTNIRYTLPKNSLVNVTIYDSRGKVVQTIVNENQSTGYYEITWDASGMSSGIYFYRITADGFSDVKKCLLLK